MTELQQKQLALLEETAKFYNLKNRSVYKGNCKYFHPTKQGCALGRLIPDKELCQRLDELTQEKTNFSFNEAFEMFPDDLKKYTWQFLAEVQELHDYEFFWTDNGISFKGEQKVDRIKRQFNLLTN